MVKNLKGDSLMTLNQLLYFQTVAKHQNFRLAASELNISQPSLSRSIANLEEELNILLFNRHGRSVSLTKYGDIFLQHANQILSDLRVAQEHMAKLAGSAGHIDIAYVFPLATRYIPHMVRTFLKNEKNKDVTFSFHQSHTPEMLEGIKSERYDVICSSYVENEPLIQFTPLLKQDMVVITPIGHPLSEQDEVDIEELERFPVIGYDKASGLGHFTKRTYRSYSLSPNIICESPDENAIASLVAENFGIALVADVDVLQHFPLKILRLKNVNWQHTVYLGYLKSHYQIPAVKNFITFVKKSSSL